MKEDPLVTLENLDPKYYEFECFVFCRFVLLHPCFRELSGLLESRDLWEMME